MNMLRNLKKWVSTHILTTYVVVLIVAMSLNFVFVVMPAYNDCRASGESVSKCAVTLQYWAQKRFWNY